MNNEEIQLEELFDRLSEGVNSLLKKRNYRSLRYSDLLPKIKEKVEIFRKTKDIAAVKELAGIYNETDTMHPEEGWGESIWFADVKVQGKEILISELFDELWEKYNVLRREGYFEEKE